MAPRAGVNDRTLVSLFSILLEAPPRLHDPPHSSLAALQIGAMEASATRLAAFAVYSVWNCLSVVTGAVGAACVVIAVLYTVISRVCWSGHVSPRTSDCEARRVLVTGCDTGFGHSVAIRLYEAGFHVYACCLTDRGVADLRSELPNRDCATVVKLDVTKQADIDAVCATIRNAGHGLWAVINNVRCLTPRFGRVFRARPSTWMLCRPASMPGPVLIGTGTKTISSSWMSTFSALFVLRRRACRSWYGPLRVVSAASVFTMCVYQKQSRGRVINVASVAGFVVFPESSAYCASKHALEAYSEALRNEMRVWNVDVSIIEPGFFDTGIVRSAADQDRRVWDRLPEATRSEYGNEWFAARYIVYTGSCTGCERSTQLVALAEGSSLIWQTQ